MVYNTVYLGTNNKVHDLKVVQPFFNMVQLGDKPFELRKDDRNYVAGDILILREYFAEEDEYTGYTLIAQVTCVISGEWLAPGCVALGIRILQ